MKHLLYNLSQHVITDEPRAELMGDFSHAFPFDTIAIDDRLILDGRPYLGLRTQYDIHNKGLLLSIVRDEPKILKEKTLFDNALRTARASGNAPAGTDRLTLLFEIGTNLIGQPKTSFIGDISHMPFAPSSFDLFNPFENDEWYKAQFRWFTTDEPNVTLVFAKKEFTAARQNGSGYMDNPDELTAQLWELVTSSVDGQSPVPTYRHPVNHLGFFPGRGDLFIPRTKSPLMLGDFRKWSIHYSNIIQCFASKTYIQDSLKSPMTKVDPTGN